MSINSPGSLLLKKSTPFKEQSHLLPGHLSLDYINLNLNGGKNMENQTQIADWRDNVNGDRKPYLKIADKEIVEFTFLNEGVLRKSKDYGDSIVFEIAKGQEIMDWFVNAENYDLLNQIKELGTLKGMLVAVGRTGTKKSDTRYTIKKLG
jgi:hypothetical protein